MGHLFSEWFTHTFPNMEWLLDLVLGIILFFFGPLPLFRKYKFFKKLIKTSGVIVSLGSGDRSYETYAKVRYSLNGKTYENWVDWIPSIIWKDEGKHIKVYIDPNDVNKVYVKQFRDSSTEVIVTVFFLLLIFVSVMLCYYTL